MESEPSKNSPILQDKALEGLAQMFLANPKDPTPGSELLDAKSLDFSVESLGIVDQHLEVMRQKNLTNQLLTKFVLRCGAYVGEVIRRNTKNKEYHWLNYDDAAKLNKNVAGFGKNLATAAILWDSKGGFTFPLGKVMKYLENGSGDSVKYFAQVFISNPN